MADALLCQMFFKPALGALLTQLLRDWHAGEPAAIEAALRTLHADEPAGGASPPLSPVGSAVPAPPPPAASAGRAAPSASRLAPGGLASIPDDAPATGEQDADAAAAAAFGALAATPTVAVVQLPVDAASFDCFRSLFAYLLQSRQMLCLGLYRRAPDRGGGGGGFVAGGSPGDGGPASRRSSLDAVIARAEAGGGGAAAADAAAPGYLYLNPEYSAPLRAGDEAVVLMRL